MTVALSMLAESCQQASLVDWAYQNRITKDA